MRQIKVTVIVPVYNVSLYIKKCATSLFEQKLDDIELIFIDDCSIDNSIFVLNEVLLNYDHMKDKTSIVRLDRNVGLHNVRKIGINLARGKYVIFCDSDDWLDKDFCSKMYNKAESNKSDIVICDYILTDGRNFEKKCKGSYADNSYDFFFDCINLKSTWAIWNKLYKKELFENIIYPVATMGEDMVLVLQLIQRAKNIYYNADSFYFYRINETSITKKKGIKSVISRYNQLSNNLNLLQREGIVKDKYLIDLLRVYNTLQTCKQLDMLKDFNRVTITFPLIEYSKILKSKDISLKNKFKTMLYYFLGLFIGFFRQ